MPEGHIPGYLAFDHPALCVPFFFFWVCVGFVGALALQPSSQLMSVCGEQAEAGDKAGLFIERGHLKWRRQACFEVGSLLVNRIERALHSDAHAHV